MNRQSLRPWKCLKCYIFVHLSALPALSNYLLNAVFLLMMSCHLKKKKKKSSRVAGPYLLLIWYYLEYSIRRAHTNGYIKISYHCHTISNWQEKAAHNIFFCLREELVLNLRLIPCLRQIVWKSR